ncbi:MAG: putative transcriptional regulator [Firmicutes bacterium]|nr:putative transcriptional regulator [Bacillota bacterium]
MEITKCPIEITLAVISGKWKFLIIRELMGGGKRFGALHKCIGPISAKILTQQLREMENDGLVARKAFSEIPPKVEYALTLLGQSLLPILVAMRKWGLNATSKHTVKCQYCKQCEPVCHLPAPNRLYSSK